MFKLSNIYNNIKTDWKPKVDLKSVFKEMYNSYLNSSINNHF